MNPPQPLEYFVSMWGKLILRSKGAYLFPLDVPEERRNDVLKGALEFIDEDPAQYPLDYPWVPANPSKRDRTQECPPDVKKLLDFAYEWYQEVSA